MLAPGTRSAHLLRPSSHGSSGVSGAVSGRRYLVSRSFPPDRYEILTTRYRRLPRAASWLLAPLVWREGVDEIPDTSDQIPSDRFARDAHLVYKNPRMAKNDAIPT